MDKRAVLMRPAIALAVLSAIIAGILCSSALATGAGSEASACAYGGVQSATILPPSDPDSELVQITGQATPGAASVWVRFEGEDVGLLPVDAGGGFVGSAYVPHELSSGDYTLDLATEGCEDPQNFLFVGDSITDGAFASSREAHYPSLVIDELSRRYGWDTWTPTVYGVSGYGSLILDDSINTDLYELNSPLFWERSWWKDADADLALIGVGVNNFPTGPGDGHDLSYRYDGTWRGYETEEEALAWWRTDVTGAVEYLTSQKGLTPDHILILGQWPYGSSNPYGRGERYVGGAQEALWNWWNQEMENLANSLGCVFVPMDDVFGAGYLPDATKPGGDPDDYINHEHGDQSIHPNDRGFAKFADRVISYLPADLEAQRYRLSFQVDRNVKLSLGMSGARWASLEDYADRILTVDMSIHNDGDEPAIDSQITDITATNGAIPVTELPMELGEVESGDVAPLDVRFLVPPGIAYFRANVSAHSHNAAGVEFDFPDHGSPDGPD